MVCREGVMVRGILRLLIDLLVVFAALALVIIPTFTSHEITAESLRTEGYDYTVTDMGFYKDKTITKGIELHADQSLQVLANGRTMFGQLDFWIEDEYGKTIFYVSGKRLKLDQLISQDPGAYVINISIRKASMIFLATGVKIID